MWLTRNVTHAQAIPIALLKKKYGKESIKRPKLIGIKESI